MAAPLLRPYQDIALINGRVHILGGRKRVILCACTGGGKCLGKGTPVLMFDGRILPVEQIQNGDLLMGPDSKPRRVRHTTRGFGKLFRIIPLRGESWVCNDAHILTLVNTTSDEVIDVDIQTYLSSSATFKHLHKQFAPSDGIDFKELRELPIDPYFLGVWYGDGSKRFHRADGGLSAIQISKPDIEIKNLCEEIASKWNLRVRTTISSSGGCPTHHLVAERSGREGSNSLLTVMQKIVGTGEAFPIEYLTASKRDREAFLAGLLDTDGYMHRTGFEIVQKRHEYANGILFLARSLGARALIREKIVNGESYWRVHLSGDFLNLPLRLPRKQAEARRQKKVATRTGFSVEPAGNGEYFGFELDGDGRFLLGDFTVTHNTVIASAIIHSARRNFNAKILFVAHRLELIDQAVGQLERWGITEVGVIRADDKRTAPLMPVQVASIQTLARRELPWVPDIIFIDECHRSAAESYQKHIFEKFPNAVIFGLTATPCRSDGKPLGRIVGGPFDALEIAASYSQCIADGFISEPKCFSCPPMQAPDLSKVHTVGGDFDLGELEEIMIGEALVSGIYDRWKELHEGRKTVIFATGVQHSQSIVKVFHEKGIRAAHLDGNTPETLRREILQKLEDGELEVVSNCQILTEGWDQPSVKCIVLARPTKSLVLYMQMCGRPLRPCCECLHVPEDHIGDDKVCSKCGCTSFKALTPLILDHAGNYDRHRAPHIDREWSLDVPPKHPKESKFKTCPECFAYIPSNARECPHCKHSFVVIMPFEPPREHNVPLVRREVVSEKRSFFEKLVREARSNGYKPGYASAKYKEEYGIWPPWSWGEEVMVMFEQDLTWQQRLSRKEEWRARRRLEEETSTDDQLAALAEQAMKDWDT